MARVDRSKKAKSRGPGDSVLHPSEPSHHGRHKFDNRLEIIEPEVAKVLPAGAKNAIELDFGAVDVIALSKKKIY